MPPVLAQLGARGEAAARLAESAERSGQQVLVIAGGIVLLIVLCVAAWRVRRS